MPLEIACFNIASALLASTNGADRIELCADPLVGGTTPSLVDFQSLKQSLSLAASATTTRSDKDTEKVPIPVNVMIRPRGGDFVYTNEEFETMSREIDVFGNQGADGFVFGILTPSPSISSNSTPELEIDADRCKILLAKTQAHGKPCTFHRAFDALPAASMLDQLEVLVGLGFTSVLTSGGAANAVEGKAMLKRLVERAEGRIEIIVGGGVRSANLGGLREEVGARWWHSSAITDAEGGEVASRDEIEALGVVLRT